jgi:hypothetical protein
MSADCDAVNKIVQVCDLQNPPTRIYIHNPKPVIFPQRLQLSVAPKDVQHKDRRIALQCIMSAWVRVCVVTLQRNFRIKYFNQVPLSSSVLQMCCDHVHSPQQSQGLRLPLLLPDPSLLLPVRRHEQQQQQQQPAVAPEEPCASSIAAAEISMWSAVGQCSTSQ